MHKCCGGKRCRDKVVFPSSSRASARRASSTAASSNRTSRRITSWTRPSKSRAVGLTPEIDSKVRNNTTCLHLPRVLLEGLPGVCVGDISKHVIEESDNVGKGCLGDKAQLIADSRDAKHKMVAARVRIVRSKASAERKTSRMVKLGGDTSRCLPLPGLPAASCIRRAFDGEAAALRAVARPGWSFGPGAWGAQGACKFHHPGRKLPPIFGIALSLWA